MSDRDNKKIKSLIRKLKRRQDKRAAEELIQEFYREMYVYAFRQVGEKEAAMDITQDVFLGMLQSIWSYDEKKSGFRTWLYRIAVHKIADYFRRRETAGTVCGAGPPESDKSRREGPESWESLENPESLEKAFGFSADKMERQVIEEELARQILLRLREEDILLEELFRLKFYSEYTFAEIAEILELPESTVKTRYYAALKKLRKEFA